MPTLVEGDIWLWLCTLSLFCLALPCASCCLPSTDEVTQFVSLASSWFLCNISSFGATYPHIIQPSECWSSHVSSPLLSNRERSKGLGVVVVLSGDRQKSCITSSVECFNNCWRPPTHLAPGSCMILACCRELRAWDCSKDWFLVTQKHYRMSLQSTSNQIKAAFAP